MKNIKLSVQFFVVLALLTVVTLGCSSAEAPSTTPTNAAPLEDKK